MSGEKLPDRAARTTALTSVDRSFLVEAGAGSGKTSIMAGRVAVLFAQGVEPKNVAAITFTEFAASELRIRIERFVNELSAGTIPPDLDSAFPKEVSGLTAREPCASKESARRACLLDHSWLCAGVDQTLPGRGRDRSWRRDHRPS